MDIVIREYKTEDVTAAITIWNQVVEDGVAFPPGRKPDRRNRRCFFQRTDLYRNRSKH